MRNLIGILGFILLAACDSAQDKELNIQSNSSNAAYFKVHYAEGDNALSVKNSVIIKAILPYNVQWFVSNNIDEGCASLKRFKGDSYILNVHPKQLENCQVELRGVVMNSYGEGVKEVSQQFTIQQAIPINANADWLASSWGVRFALPGGNSLSENDANWIEGAKEVVNELSSFGHVMLNLTANARGFQYLLRDNTYVDIANEIHPDMVPSLSKSKLLFDVIDIFKANNKKVILYIAADGPAAYMLQRHGHSNVELETAWENYYQKNHAGDEGAAWRDLIRGFVEPLKDKVDGFWIDHVDHMPGEVSTFIAMLKEVNPKFAVALNRGKNYLKDSEGRYIKVAADKFGPIDKPYKVVSLTPLDAFSDFTSGHPTPLAYGAKPNAWAYEEYTFKEVKQSPWVFNKGKPVLRHWFGPMRTKWNSGDLLFEPEQAYRFVRTITDAGGAITWANTVSNGSITKEDLAILKEVDNRMLTNEYSPYVAYTRPKGAKLIN